MCSFHGQTLFWTFLRNGWSDWCETKRKCIGWMLGIICDLDHRPHSWPWPWIFQGLISKYLYLGNCWSVKWKGSELIGYWADYMTLPFDHTHDLDLAVSRSESEITLSQEWHVRLTWNEKDGSHPFMTMILTSVTVVGWVDVPDRDRGDFRRGRVVDISSLLFDLKYKQTSKSDLK